MATITPGTNSTRALVVDHDPASTGHMEAILRQSGTRFQTVRSTEAAYRQLRADPALSLVLVRFRGPEIDGCELCRRIRTDPAQQQPMILVIVPEDRRDLATEALRAGASDVLLEPFEAREMRIKANLTSLKDGLRIDPMHTTGAPSAEGSPSPELMPTTTLITPQFDPLLRRFVHPAEPVLTGHGVHAPGVMPVQLDRIMVCPRCGGLPTFRMGCPGCGSAWCEQETLIHHYACAHVGRETDFRQGTDIRCPKCRVGGLVAGADFEITGGGFVCADCGIVSGQLELIGHCLSCDYRFPARDAVVQKLTGYRLLERPTDQPSPQSGSSPGSHRPQRRQPVANL